MGMDMGIENNALPQGSENDVSHGKASASADEALKQDGTLACQNGEDGKSAEIADNAEPVAGDSAPENSLPAEKKKKRARYIAIPFIIVGYVLIGMLVSFLTARSGIYPAGSDTMFYVYRGDLLYNSIKDSGNFYPLIDPQWYNGVQTLRYWSPLSAWILAGCQALAGGGVFDGYLIFVGLMYFFCAIPWMYIGYRHDRPVLGSLIGAIWFFVPNNLFMLYAEGVLARAISMTVMPIFVVAIYDYLKEGSWKKLPTIILSFIFIIMCHVGWAGMVLISVAIFFLFYYILNRKSLKGTHRILSVAVSCALSMVICGIWVIPSLIGGITGIDSSSVMANFFQPLITSINPISVTSSGVVNRWSDSAVNLTPYFGFAAFILAILGAFLSKRDSAPGFITAFSICLMTTTAAYPILILLPGSQYLWMLRFISIALTFLFVSLFFWKSLKKWILCVTVGLLTIESFLGIGMLTGKQNWAKPQERYDSLASRTFIDIGKSLTVQRMSRIEPFGGDLESIYIIAGYGYKDNTVATSYGQGIQSAAIYNNVVQLNESSEQQCHLYTFDRALELGNDTVLIPTCNFKNSLKPVNVNEIDYAARKSGYNLIDSNDNYRLYHLDEKLLEDVDKNFGVISEYRGIGIGRSAPTISIDFPTVEETVSWCINDYTYEQLSQYDIVFLAGFTYTDKAAAEEMLIKLSENGTRIIIMADGIPSDEHTGSRSFLGLECYPIRFKNGYPELDTIDGYLNCDLFPAGYTDWLTVYVNGLDEVWGTLDDFEQDLPFYGTVKNDNIVVIGLNLSYHYALTKDPTVGALLSHAYRVNSYELPQREIVPLQIDYYNDRIEIVSDYDDVCTTLAWHDIFDVDNGAYTKNHLTFVNKGRTVIKLRYPYFWRGLSVTVFGLVVSVIFILNAKKRWEKDHPDSDDCTEPADGESDEEASIQPEDEATPEPNFAQGVPESAPEDTFNAAPRPEDKKS